MTGLQRRLLAWYDAHRRALPWRDLDDPYAIWVSEVMLQQTRVETAIPYFLRWMARFPDVQALARADTDDVLRAWSGLGYYSRARNLQDGARQVVAAGGALPTDVAGWRALPGVGPYTAGAIASIALGVRAPAVDGNVLRVLARWRDDDGDITRSATRRRFAAHAAELVDASRPGDWNQALMELGATVCTPRAPRCTDCPVQSHCGAFAAGTVAERPVRSKRPAVETVAVRLAWVEHDGRILLVRNTDEGLLQGLWGLPGGTDARPLADRVRAQTGVSGRDLGPLARSAHRFTHRHWQVAVHRMELDPLPRADADRRWVDPAHLDDVAVSTAHRKAIAAVLTARAALEVPAMTAGS